MVTLRSETVKTKHSKHNIRNVTVIGSAGIDVADTLLIAPEMIYDEITCQDLATGAIDRSLHFEINTKSIENHNDPSEGNKYLVNLIHPPRPDDDAQDIMSTLCIPDGLVLVVDCIQGITQKEKKLLQHALIERIRPVLIVDMSEESFFELFVDGEKAYRSLFSVVDGVNTILKTCNDKLLGDVQVHPQDGNVLFSCASLGWAFTVTRFALVHAASFDLDKKTMKDKIWGDHFYDPATNAWSYENTGSPTCTRGFVWSCWKPIKEILDCCMADRKTELWSLLKQHNVVVKDDQMALEGVSLLKSVLGTWSPANTSLLELIIHQLPSPERAQKYRVENLYKGPLNDKYANAIRRCQTDGPLMVYISKTIRSKDKTVCAVGRVFSGRVTCGMSVRVMGPNYICGENNDLHLQTVTYIGKKDHQIKDVHSGNIVALAGLAKCRNKATLTDSHEVGACPLRAMNITPDLKVVDPGDVSLLGIDANDVFHLPFRIYDSLYMHQREAVMWLWSLYCRNTGAILGDDMGLGKSREVGAFLAGLLHSQYLGTTLLLAPATIVDQWVLELEKVEVQAKTFANPKDKSNIRAVVKKGGVLVTSHEAFRDCLANLGEYWDYVVVDEGHRIKNPETELFKALKGVATKHRLIVTGTPIQNNLKELHALMSFCHPKLLGNIVEFESKFILPIDRGKHRDAEMHMKQKSAIVLKELKTLIKPFILRRTKQLLKTEGRLKCDKHEIVAWIRLTPFQEKIYTALVTHDALRTRGAAFSALPIAADIANHPKLLLSKEKEVFPSEETEEKAESIHYDSIKNSLLKICDESLACQDESSCKLMFLLSLVAKLREEKHKILIFAQSPRSLDFIQSALSNITKEGCVIRMDGSTSRRERTTLMDHFQASLISPPHIFLMTSKVGGVGVTLTNASRVILFDPSSNPSDNNQSVDRAYRIGQTKDVLVYRLFTCATVEEHTYRQQILKGETSVSLLGEFQCKRGISTQDRNVLSMPPRGFGYCQTHAELGDVYGYEGFDRGLKVHLDQIKSNKFVIDITNHSLLFSIEEDMVVSSDSTNLMDEGFRADKLPQKTRKSMKQAPKAERFVSAMQENNEMRSFYMKLEANVRIDYTTKKNIQRISGAAINFLDKHMSQTGSQHVELVGTPAEIKVAQKRINDFIKENLLKTKSTMLIPRKKGGLLIGKGGETIKKLSTSSGAHIRTFPERIIKDHPDEQIVEITGTEDTVKSAKEMIRKKIEKGGKRQD